MNDFINFLKARKNLVNLLVLVVIILGLPIGISLVRNQQILFSRAQVGSLKFIIGECVTSRNNQLVATCIDPITVEAVSPIGPPGTLVPPSIPPSIPPSTQPPGSGSPPPIGEILCQPASQSVAKDQPANFSVVSQNPNNIKWTATNGTPASGTGLSFSTKFSTKGNFKVSVTDGGPVSECTVTVSSASDKHSPKPHHKGVLNFVQNVFAQECTPDCSGDQCGQDDGCGGSCPSDDSNTPGKCGNPDSAPPPTPRSGEQPCVPKDPYTECGGSTSCSPQSGYVYDVQPYTGDCTELFRCSNPRQIDGLCGFSSGGGNASCNVTNQSPDLGSTCARCIINNDPDLPGSIKNNDPAKFACYSDQQLLNYWCNSGLSSGPNGDDCTGKKAACGSACGVSGGGGTFCNQFQSPSIPDSCQSCIEQKDPSLVQSIKDQNPDALGSCSNTQLLNYFCNGGIQGAEGCPKQRIQLCPAECSEFAGGGNTCKDNPVPPPPGSYIWKADCSKSCSQNSDCPQNTSDPSNVNPDTSNWCYGGKCLQLQYTGSRTNPNPRPSVTALPSPTAPGGRPPGGTNPPNVSPTAPGGGSTPPGVNPTAPGGRGPAVGQPGETTAFYRFAENPDDLINAPKIPYTSEPVLINTKFANDKPGEKFIFVEFIGSKGTVVRKSEHILFVGPDPKVTSKVCSTSLSEDGVKLHLIGRNFGQDRGSLQIAGVLDTKINQWDDNTIDAFLKFSLSRLGQVTDIPLTLLRKDGVSSQVVCTIGQLEQLELGTKLFCRQPNSHGQDSVEMVIVQNETSPSGTSVGTPRRETVSIDPQGKVKGLQTKFEVGQTYTVSIKAPKSLRRVFTFTASDGTNVIPDLILPIGDIFPLGGGDGVINSADKAELNREWGQTQSSGARPADFNKDTKVNSFDWACMRYDFGQRDDPEPQVGSFSSSTSSPEVTATIDQLNRNPQVNQSDNTVQNQTNPSPGINVPGGAKELAVALTWPKGRDKLKLILTDPQGRRVDLSYPDTTILDDGLPPVYFIVGNPLPGTWYAQVYGADVPDGTVNYNLLAATS